MPDRDFGALAWPAGLMLARPVEVLPPTGFLRGGCLYEQKWDGYRALVAVDSQGCGLLRSRRAVDLSSAFPDIAAAAAAQLPRGSILDGELVVWDGHRLAFTSCSAGSLPRAVRPPSASSSC